MVDGAAGGARLNAMRLEVMELTERSEHSLQFLGDMYYSKAYRVAAQRIGVDDYKGLVDGKLHTAGELYQFLIEQVPSAESAFCWSCWL